MQHDRPVLEARRFAVVQDYLCAFAGGERVALAIAEMLSAPVYTSLFDANRTFDASGMEIHASWLSRFDFFRADHRRALPFLPFVFGSMTVEADVVLCTTAGWAHGVRADGRKVAYWESPAKWLHRPDDYRAAGTLVGRAALLLLRKPLLWWDARAVRTVDLHLANSTFTRDLLQSIYGIDAHVIPCPHTMSSSGPQSPAPELLRKSYLLCVCRLLPYKNVEALVRVMHDLPEETLYIVGTGPERARLQESSPSNVLFLGSVSEARLRWLYAHCYALLTASREDFGLTPLEAATFGRPSIALRWGGFLDTVIEDRTGVFFDTATAESISSAIVRTRAIDWDEAAIRDHADQFSAERFAERLHQVLAEHL
jgi:glycosyltransferase involved in cell wall biosynthesis